MTCCWMVLRGWALLAGGYLEQPEANGTKRQAQVASKKDTERNRIGNMTKIWDKTNSSKEELVAKRAFVLGVGCLGSWLVQSSAVWPFARSPVRNQSQEPHSEAP